MVYVQGNFFETARSSMTSNHKTAGKHERQEKKAAAV